MSTVKQPPVPAEVLPASLLVNPLLSSWLQLSLDGHVIVSTGKVEIGQGILTALAQIAAEELDVLITRVRMVSGTTAGGPDEGITSGSRSVNEGGGAMRQACAYARQLLLAAAATRLGLDASALSVVDGHILHAGSDTGLDYWKLPHEHLLGTPLKVAAANKRADRYSIVGRSVARLDLPDKVMGRPAFVHDMELPGMLFGRMVRSPEGNLDLLSFDGQTIESMPGVVALVQDGSFIGVIAEREEQAVRARHVALGIARWHAAKRPTDNVDVYDWLQEQPSVDQLILSHEGADACAFTRHRLSARYTKPYIAHASLGPSCALAHFRHGCCEVWTHSQSVYPLRLELARVLGLQPADVIVHHADGSGCYGHNGADDVALDAALLSRAVGGRPVKVQWMREDEFVWEPYGPAMVVQMQAGLSSDGCILDWTLDAWSNGHLSRPGAAKDAGHVSALLGAWQLADPIHRAPQIDPPMGPGGIEHGGIGRNAVTTIYDLPQQRVITHRVEKLPLRVSSLRGIGAYANIFAIESFIDELAFLAGADPLEYRLRHLCDARARAVLERAATVANWQPGDVSDGMRGRGLACAQYSNHLGYFALVLDLCVDPDLKVTRVVAAVDVGQVINPDGVINQIEGGIVQAISWSLKEAIRFDRGGVLSKTWEDYPILVFGEVPEIEVHLINRPGDEPLGAGEITMGPVAAAIANAAHHALGLRLRDLPMTRERVLAAV